MPEAESAFEVIMLEVAIDPPTLPVKVFPEAESEFGTDKFVKVALVATRFVFVAFATFKFVPTMFARFALPVAVMFVPVALSNNRFEM